ncbi:hypothetical protein [Niabella drilacis]|uniref:Uncharacterized protein n=1 Tax=Niabella drilacis (strain DSM 25811 / CCM 8410 / CCUG 62505 / LMG 26954 / E90) TaxID=1285928 RepID=A0A1G6LE58_NIADE|nr:hypothetical protein [Niabella drilacis]SDC41501.1 hypothetical protein SAMN04487894_102317 [Niabella drilacis]
MIYVFKTSVQRRKDVLRLQPVLNDLLPSLNWNFDLDDCDKILRVESAMEIAPSVIRLLREAGFDCEELAC